MRNLLVGFVILSMVAHVATWGAILGYIDIPTQQVHKTVFVPYTPPDYLTPPDAVFPEETQKVYKMEYTPEEFKCLHQNIYWEARNQGTKGKEIIGIVTVNRKEKEGYPSTLCGVVKSKNKKTCAFSWYCDGKSDIPRLKHPDERMAWEKSKKVAENVLKGQTSITGPMLEADHYHADYVTPYWAKSKRMMKLGKIENHIIYKRG